MQMHKQAFSSLSEIEVLVGLQQALVSGSNSEVFFE